jgi:hypothetical protein
MTARKHCRLHKIHVGARVAWWTPAGVLRGRVVALVSRSIATVDVLPYTTVRLSRLVAVRDLEVIDS